MNKNNTKSDRKHAKEVFYGKKNLKNGQLGSKIKNIENMQKRLY